MDVALRDATLKITDVRRNYAGHAENQRKIVALIIGAGNMG